MGRLNFKLCYSIENFKRPQSEVDGLLDLARDKFRRLLQEQDRLKEHGIRVRVIGNITLLPDDLKDLISQAEKATETNDERILNVAFSYTSREEIAQVRPVIIRSKEHEQINLCLIILVRNELIGCC